jgi:hypothetical protein
MDVVDVAFSHTQRHQPHPLGSTWVWLDRRLRAADL